jgi:hypothetical protein
MKKRFLYYLKAALLIVGLFGSCAIVFTLAFDSMCYNVLSQRLPIYPGAKITLERYSFMRRYGMGETIMVLDSDDAVEIVRDWYGRARGRVSQQVRRDNTMNLFYGFTRAVASVTTAEDGTGSQIVLSGACAAG